MCRYRSTHRVRKGVAADDGGLRYDRKMLALRGLIGQLEGSLTPGDDMHMPPGHEQIVGHSLTEPRLLRA